MNKLILLLSIPLLVCFASCCKDGDDSNGSQSSKLVKITGSDNYSPKELAAAVAESYYIKDNIGDNEAIEKVLNSILNLYTSSRRYSIDTVYARKQNVSMLRYRRNWQIESHTFHYQSVSSFGEPIVLSGRITFPNTIENEGHEVKSLSLYVHHYIGKDIVPSAVLSPIPMRSLLNSAVIEPDLQGYGAAADSPFCGLSYEAQGRQISDCVEAALDLMRQRGVVLSDDGYTTAWGYSLAEPACVAFVRHYEQRMTQEQRKRINLTQAFVGGGPMLMDQLMMNFDSDLDFNAVQSSYVCNLLEAVPQSEFGDYSVRDFLPEWMLQRTVTIDGQEYVYYDTKQKGLPIPGSVYPEGYDESKLRCNFASDMTNADGHINYSNPKTICLMDVLHRLSDWGDWMPQTDIYINHCPQDDRMPYLQDKAFYNDKKASGHVYWKDVDVSVLSKLMSVSNHHAATLYSTALMVLYEKPADAFRKL